MSRVMIVDDDINIRNELKILLENSRYEVDIIEDFGNIIDAVKKESPDIILLDVNLPYKNGTEICREIRKFSDIPIIFVTSNNTSMDELNCIMGGGDDFISKPYNIPILLARINAVLKRTKKNDSNREDKNMLFHKGVQLNVPSAIITCNENQVELSKNELKILFYLLCNKEKIVPREDIIDYLWDNQVFIDDSTLSVNITRLRNKLSSIGAENFIETKRGLGYKI